MAKQHHHHHHPPDTEDPQLITYRALRIFVGVIAFSLPFVLVIGLHFIGKCPDGALRPSISQYYYTKMGNYLVGALCALGFFLVAYKGYNKKENWVFNLAGALAVCVAFCPSHLTPEPVSASLCTTCPTPLPCPSCTDCFVRCTPGTATLGTFHFIFASILLGTLAYISYKWFTKTKPGGTMSEPKKIRNIIYKVCGIGIGVTIVVLAIYDIITRNETTTDYYTFWGESICLWFFGAAWLVKGEVVLKG